MLLAMDHGGFQETMCISAQRPAPKVLPEIHAPAIETPVTRYSCQHLLWYGGEA